MPTRYLGSKLKKGFRETPAVYLLLLSFTAVIFYEYFLALNMGQEALNAFIEQYYFKRSLIDSGRYYVLFTSIFLHAGFAHFASNSVILYLAGKPLERYLGTFKFLLTFFISAFAGSGVMYFLTDGGAVGASGGVSGVIAAAALLVPTDSLIDEIPVVRFFSVPGVRTVFSTVILGAYWIFQETAMTALKYMDLINNKVGHGAHFGGIVGGALLAYVFFPRESKEGAKLTFLIMLMLLGLITLQPFTTLWYGLGAALIISLLAAERRQKKRRSLDLD